MAAKTTRKDPVERKEGDERKKALNAALASIEKQFGKGAIIRTLRSFLPVRLVLISRLVWVDCRAAVLLKYMAQSLPARRRFRFR